MYIIREKWSLTISNDIDLLVMVRVPEQLPNARAHAGSGEGRGGRHGGVRHLQAHLGSSAHRGQGGQQSVIIKLIMVVRTHNRTTLLLPCRDKTPCDVTCYE